MCLQEIVSEKARNFLFYFTITLVVWSIFIVSNLSSLQDLQLEFLMARLIFAPLLIAGVFVPLEALLYQRTGLVDKIQIVIAVAIIMGFWAWMLKSFPSTFGWWPLGVSSVVSFILGKVFHKWLA